MRKPTYGLSGHTKPRTRPSTYRKERLRRDPTDDGQQDTLLRYGLPDSVYYSVVFKTFLAERWHSPATANTEKEIICGLRDRIGEEIGYAMDFDPLEKTAEYIKNKSFGKVYHTELTMRFPSGLEVHNVCIYREKIGKNEVWFIVTRNNKKYLIDRDKKLILREVKWS